jgi:hypothetical protein
VSLLTTGLQCLQKQNLKGQTPDGTSDQKNVKVLFEDNAIADMLEFVEKTEVGKRPGAVNNKVDSWDIERLDRRDEEGEGAVGNSGV